MDGKDTGDYPLLATDFVQVLQMRAAAHGADAAFTILSEDGRVADAIDYAGLDRRASAVAALVRQHCAPGDRVLLLLPTGIDYVAAFFGVLNAGAIAVPLFLPANRRHLDRLHGIAQDCKPTLALGEAQAEALSPVAKQALDELAVSGVPWVSLDGDALGSGDAGPASSASAVGGDGPVLLQYTSGSTGVAKGVMVTHDNLMHNAQATFLAGRGRRSDVSVSWLPLFHDMGLMLGVLQPVFGGMHAVLMQPASFLRRPYRWLRAISDFRATISTAPNFAFDQCVDNVTDAELSTLDLSAWRRAGVSAEPIRANTLRRFSARFQAAGFRAANFAPSYGLAESTLVVTMPKLESPLHVLRASRDTLAQDARLVASADDDAYELVGCGEPVGQLSVAIVNPETCRALPEGAVGEIWVHGPSVAQGYWNQQEATQERFCASLADADRQPWMRTGDLGALVGGELMVNGRIDDLMQIRGRSVFPQDVERAAAQAHASVRADGVAAFVVDDSGDAAELAVVAEVDRGMREPSAVVLAICGAVTEECGSRPAKVVLIRGGTLPRTSSGKVQRRLTRSRMKDGTLKVIHAWQAPVEQAAQARADVAHAPCRGEADLVQWLCLQLSRISGFEVALIDPESPFAHHGIDSIHLVRLSVELEAFCGIKLAPSVFWNYPSPRSLAQHISSRLDVRRAGAQAPESIGASDGLQAGIDTTAEDRVAIIGYACRLPGVPGTDGLWAALSAGGDAIGAAPALRPGQMTLDGATPMDAGYIAGIEMFDARFFGISPLEARYMDPQQRLVLELVWEALERSGQSAAALRGSRTGVFVGVATGDYGLLLNAANCRHRYAATGTASSIVANRVSYLLDLRGPSLTIDTACSSSLVAVHLARQALRNGECDLAIVAGVNALLDPGVTRVLAEAGMMSPEARCKVFDEHADGYVRGEGCVALVMRPERDALARRDRIVARLLGSAVQHDGRTNGLTAPNGLAQQVVIRQALKDAGVRPRDVNYVEAHGSGTALGDPIEIEALKAVFDDGEASSRCGIGSIKAAVGHLEAAAGLAGVAKVLCMLERRAIPPQPNFRRLNPHIDLDHSRLDIARVGTEWQPDGTRIAGVSAFSFGGVNAHIVLADHEAADVDRSRELPGPMVALVSAPTSADLVRVAQQLADGLPLAAGDAALESFCLTLAAGRAHHACRAALVVSSLAGLQAGLHQLAATLDAAPRPHAAAAARVTLVFGDDSAVMLRDLVQCVAVRLPAVARHLADFDTAWRSAAGEQGASTLQAGRLDVLRAHHAFFAWLSGLGVGIQQVVGIGQGHLSAAWASGSISLGEAIAVGLGQLRPDQAVISVGTVGWAEPRGLLAAGDLLAGLAGSAALGAESRGPDDTLAPPALVLEVGDVPINARTPSGWAAAPRFQWLASAGRESVWALLGALYERGVDLDWAAVYGGADLRKVELPTYPFLRERHWAPELEAEPGLHRQPSPVPAAPTPRAAPAATREDELAYITHWLPVSVLMADIAADGDWTLFDPATRSDPLAIALCQELERRGARVAPHGLLARRDGRAEASSSAPLGVIYLQAESLPGDEASAIVCAEMLAFVQHVRTLAQQRPVRAWFLSRGTFGAPAREEPQSAGALVWGLARAFAAESSRLWGGLLDIGVFTDAESCAVAIAGWLNAGDLAWRQARLHEGRLEIPRLRPAGLRDLAEENIVRAGASYVVTGGWGSLGLQSARYLAARGARRVVLVGRNAPPPRNAWPELTADHPWRGRVDAAWALEDAGVTLSWKQCDVSQADQVIALLDELRRDMPAVAGIVHTAGRGEFVPLNRLTAAYVEEECAAKRNGALHLLRYAGELDFLVMASSVASLIGAGGLGAYAAANGALDSIAQQWAARPAPARGHRRVRSIQWGVLSSGGLLSEPAQYAVLRERGFGVLSEAEVHAGLDAALQSGHPTLLVARMNWARFSAHRLKIGQPDELSADLVPADAGLALGDDAGVAAGHAGHAEHAWPTATVQALAAIWCKVLEVQHVGVQDSFFELGGDSLGLVDVLAEVESVFGLAIALSDAFEAARLDAMAALIDRELEASASREPAPAAAAERSALSLADIASIASG